MARISRHFFESEVVASRDAAREGIKNVPGPVAWKNARRLAKTIGDPIRDHAGVVNPTSWYRSRKLNEFVDGAKGSYHRLGLAFDIQTPQMSLAKVALWVVEESRIPYDIIIYEYGSWLHVQAAKPGRRPRKKSLMKFYGEDYALLDFKDSRVV